MKSKITMEQFMSLTPASRCRKLSEMASGSTCLISDEISKKVIACGKVTSTGTQYAKVDTTISALCDAKEGRR